MESRTAPVIRAAAAWATTPAITSAASAAAMHQPALRFLEEARKAKISAVKRHGHQSGRKKKQGRTALQRGVEMEMARA